MKYQFSLLSLFLLFILTACNQKTETSIFRSSKPNFDKMEPFDKNGNLIAVVEIPAGTNKKIEYNKESRKFEIDKKKGKDRIINFLPYPGNYGFIPSTLMDKERGGDGDAIDVLVLCENQPSSTLIPIIPIAALILYDEGEMDTKIIGIPVDSSLQTMPMKNYEEFRIDYDPVRRMIEDWFLNYDGQNTTQLGGWRDADFAKSEVEKWKKREEKKEEIQ